LELKYYKIRQLVWEIDTLSRFVPNFQLPINYELLINTFIIQCENTVLSVCLAVPKDTRSFSYTDH
jgi:hypothetical protein